MIPIVPILIVDDNATNLKLVRLILDGHGYLIRTAHDAVEALESLTKFRPRLILMDLQLPGMNGLELTRRLRADRSNREIIIVALSAYAMKGDEEKALAAGCEGYITKPLDPETLPATVAGYLALRG